jgi:cytidine deaminase
VDVERLVRAYDLESLRGLALLALPVAARLAQPSISSYRVGVIGIDDEGDLVVGANLEFPGADLASTIHAEGFASLRARARGRTLRVLALTEAHPCAHCRQTLTESAGAGELELIDPLGHALRLADLYPWPFTPAALKIEADDPSRVAWPELEIVAEDVPYEVRGALLDAARRAHAPYSRCPSAVVLQLRDERFLAAGCVESVSFNPSITAMQAALVELAAVGELGGAVERAWLGRLPGGAVDPVAAARSLLRAVAPGVELGVAELR